MFIIDFYGMPGSGKSTVSHKLADELRNSGYIVEEPSWTTDRLPAYKRLAKKFFGALICSIRYPNKIGLALKKAETVRMSIKASIKLWINTGYIMYSVLRKSAADYRIFDQGIAQAVISLYTENRLDTYKDVYSDLSEHFSNILNIYVKVSKETAAERMALRSNGKSRAEKLNRSEQMNMLSRIEELCENITDDRIVYENNTSTDGISKMDADITDICKSIINQSKGRM